MSSETWTTPQRTRPRCDGCGVQATPGVGWRVRIRRDGKSYCPDCRQADPLPPKSEHKCVECQEIKDLAQFYISKGRPSGPCKPCTLNRSRAVKYGVDGETFAAKLTEQGGRCAICFGILEGRKACQDHNHETGKTRAILCSECNTALGMMRDRPDLLRRAAEYLEVWND